MLRKRVGYRNSFQTVLAVEWSADDPGTRIVCNARLHIGVMLFLFAWFGGVLLIGGPLMAASFLGALQGDGNHVWPQVLVIMLGGIAIVALGRFSARDEERFLLQFVSEVLEVC